MPLGQLVHGCNLLWIVTATTRARNYKGLRKCLLRMVDSLASTTTHQRAKTHLRRCEHVLPQDRQSLSQSFCAAARGKYVFIYVLF